MMAEHDSEPGFYGKLPILGDFVLRRLPRDFLTPWDNWLQSSIKASREELGEAWLASYLSSPIWRFILSSGVCGNSAWAGILMPSVDKVGRYFPLTVAARFECSDCLPYLMTSANSWYQRLEDVALSGLEDGLELEVFDNMVRTIEPLLTGRCTESGVFQEVQSYSGKKAFHVEMSRARQANDVNDAFVGLSSVLLNRFMPGYSLWSTAGSDEFEAVLLACEGLPPLAAYSGFINGRISGRGWNLWSLKVPEDSSASVQVETNADNLPVSSSEQVRHADSEQDTVRLVDRSDTLPLNGIVWQSWAITDTGKRRKLNEDAILNKPSARLWVVADGMGGHQAGDVASQMIVERLNRLSPSDILEVYVDEVRRCILDVNQKLRELSNKNYHDSIVGSTVMVLIADENRCAYLWAGDSRLYRFRDNQLAQLTRDHCIEDEAVTNPAVSSMGWSVKQSNVITRAVGADDELELDCLFSDVKPGDIFLLSSDGLDKELSFDEIESILSHQELKNSAAALVDLVLERGARDNVSVIVVNAGFSS
ncbi:MAG: hypothetical protein Kow0065_22810 [Methylomicrobium sp.]